VLEHWYNKNESRAYPCHDLATLISDSGERLPDNILVDCNIWVPDTLCSYVFLSSATVTGSLVSLTFMGVQEDPFSPDYAPETPIPLAAISVNQPVPYRNYTLAAYSPGVVGWVTFGSGAKPESGADVVSLRFSAPESTRIICRGARSYPQAPITGVKKDGGSPMTGIVKLRGTGDISVRGGTRVIDGVEREVILIGLDRSYNNDNLSKYLGPCDGRPESNTCGRRPIMRINNVPPDSEGNIDLEFSDMSGGEEIGVSLIDHGIIMDTPLGVSDICKARVGASRDYDPCDPEGSYARLDVQFTAPESEEDLHFQLEISDRSDFSDVLESHDSSVSQDHWYQRVGESWDPFPAGGCTSGTTCRVFNYTYALQVDSVYYYRVRSFDGLDYSDWATGLTYVR